MTERHSLGSELTPDDSISLASAPVTHLDKPEIVLNTQGLSRSFGKVRAVDHLDMNVAKGQIYGFLGVNGAGKTTTIRMLMGIIQPDNGTIELLGERTRRTTIRQKRAIGYVSQEQTFYPWMTGRQLGRFVGGFYPTWDASEFDRLLRVLELPADRKASQLSGGMRVKLALALALAPRPALLILDEPTSGLDPVARREFLEIIHRQSRDHGRTTFFSSHIIGEVERVADCVGIIHQGKMRYEGDLETLRLSIRRLTMVVAEFADASLAAGSTGSEANVVPPPLPFPANEPYEVLRDEIRDGIRRLIIQAPPAFWQTAQQSGVEVTSLSLEDIFIALVGTSVSAI
jgi:ABC-2 type transport system ATP-binding protein